MFTIGDFARHGRVSVRMLRHYDAIGLLVPEYVDPATGYRHYGAAQLARLNRIVALKDLGFTLSEVATVLDDDVDVAELRGMLRLRRTELQQQIAADRARLTQVETRLRIIESEETMSTPDVVVKSLPAVRVAELTATADGYQSSSIGPVISPLFGELSARLQHAGVPIAGTAISEYEDTPEGAVLIHAGVVVNAEPSPQFDFAIRDLATVDRAATLVHRGAMDTVDVAWQALGRWIDDNGYRTAGSAREQTIEYTEDPAGWVTELQWPIAG
ncbi:MAG TPA: MerR family transcriptional regulator [Aldersonia sp.]